MGWPRLRPRPQSRCTDTDRLRDSRKGKRQGGGVFRGIVFDGRRLRRIESRQREGQALGRNGSRFGGRSLRICERDSRRRVAPGGPIASGGATKSELEASVGSSAASTPLRTANEPVQSLSPSRLWRRHADSSFEAQGEVRTVHFPTLTGFIQVALPLEHANTARLAVRAGSVHLERDLGCSENFDD